MRVQDFHHSCLCFVVGVLLGRQGSVFSTRALSNQALFCGAANISARATQSLKMNTTRGIKSKVIVVVLMNNRCLESSQIQLSVIQTPLFSSPTVPRRLLDTIENCHRRLVLERESSNRD